VRWPIVVVAASQLLIWGASARGWEQAPTLAALVARAAAEHRVVLAKLELPACLDCHRLDRELGRPSVVGALSHCLRASYDAEAGEGRDVARRYNVVVFPTVLVIGSDGLEIDRITGWLPGGRLAARVEQIRRRRETVDALERRAAARPGDLPLGLRVGTAWARRGERPRAEPHLLRVAEGDPGNQRGLAAPALLALGDTLLLRSLGHAAEAEAVLTELRRRFPRSAAADQALLPLARAMAAQGRAAQGLALLTRVAREGRSAAGHQRVARFCLLEMKQDRTATLRGIEHGQRAVAAAPRRAEWWATLAVLVERAGQTARALQAWTRAAALAPSHPWYATQRRRLGATR
jgi:tetratricopeptide (TPR) repeat protein